MPVVVTPADVRSHANLPSEVPEALLTRHIGIATRDLTRATGLADAPVERENEWSEALIVRALASAFPWLNTFALDGAAKVGRLEGAVEARFLTADEVEARVKDLNDRFDELVAQIIPAPEQGEDDQITTDLGWMAAI